MLKLDVESLGSLSGTSGMSRRRTASLSVSEGGAANVVVVVAKLETPVETEETCESGGEFGWALTVREILVLVAAGGSTPKLDSKAGRAAA